MVQKKLKILPFFEDLEARPFELQVWFVVTAIAALRAFKSVVQNVFNNTHTTGLVIDILIFLILCGLCLLIHFRKITQIPLIVGVILLILLIFSYVQFGGVLGTTEYNIMGLGVLFALAYNRKQLVFMMTLYVVAIVLANVDLRLGGWLTKTFFKRISTSLDNYVTTLVTLLLVITYFKKALIRESRRIVELRIELGAHIKKISRQKKELKEQKQFLRTVNARLKEEIKDRSSEISRQNKAMKDYIWLSTESLQMPLIRINGCVTDLNENSLLETKLREQVEELNVVVQNLKSDLTRHQYNDQ